MIKLDYLHILKKQENKLTEVEALETTALANIEADSTSTRLNVNNSMWEFASECECTGDEEEIFFHRNQANHNSVGPVIANQQRDAACRVDLIPCRTRDVGGGSAAPEDQVDAAGLDEGMVGAEDEAEEQVQLSRHPRPMSNLLTACRCQITCS